MDQPLKLDTRPFEPQDQEAVRDLINQGLGEHWGHVDPSKNPDLEDIAKSYESETFLVAWREGQIIATGALVQRTSQTGEIVRMSVARHFRRQGIGRQMLDALCQQAWQRGFNRLILETTATWDEVIDFYLSYGFRKTHDRDGDVYFCLDL